MLSCTPRVALYLCGDWYEYTSRKPTDVIMRPKNHNHESYSSLYWLIFWLKLTTMPNEKKKVYICLCIVYKCAD